MVKVICKQCKNQIDKKEALQITEEGKKRSIYFCSDDEYKQYSLIQDEKNRQIELDKLEKQKFNELDIYIASEILGYEVGQIVPPFLKKRVKKLAQNYDYEVIKLCFEYMKKDLNYYLSNKEFEDDQHKVNYIMIVIENNINDTYKIWKRKKELQAKHDTHNIDINILDEINNTTHHQNKETNGIMDFLEEEDM